ncbi:hypothetical protein GO998_08995 [Ralstonia syzygii]|uniref:Uncharacterized protein n=1 Tax=Ralstonia syzygii TaxID=28097 RepID=A0ABX7ZF51_9RALS|nr:hypothetical protein [Ralstonia syzygii]QUP53877.1 hypothetical protein GO998_08995 [Ralstonia syzygii]
MQLQNCHGFAFIPVRVPNFLLQLASGEEAVRHLRSGPKIVHGIEHSGERASTYYGADPFIRSRARPIPFCTADRCNHGAVSKRARWARQSVALLDEELTNQLKRVD